jgi:hypothetical protein
MSTSCTASFAASVFSEPCVSLEAGWSRTRWLTQWKACLPIRTAFHPLHGYPMNPSTIPLLHVKLHPLATASASSVSPSTKAISSAIPLAPTVAFHGSSRACPSRLREPPAKVLRKLEYDSNGPIALHELVQIGRLLSRTALLWPH